MQESLLVTVARHNHGKLACSFLALALVFQTASQATAQDGASYDPHAEAYRAPALSLAGAKDTPERTAAIGLLWQGDLTGGVVMLTKLAESGDVPSALLL